jgi:hypothetical protein
VSIDLADPAHADKHASPLHADHDPVDARRSASEIDHRINDSSDVGAVATEERQPS